MVSDTVNIDMFLDTDMISVIHIAYQKNDKVKYLMFKKWDIPLFYILSMVQKKVDVDKIVSIE